MKRSEFLKLGALATIGLSIPKHAFPRQETRGKVLIVGAGISGIGAANYLQSNNWEVQVIEARTRLGGRIWTDRSMGKPVDMGASWIHESSGNPINKLAKQFQIRTKETNWESVSLYDYQGKKYSDKEVSKIIDEGDWVTKKAYKLAGRQTQDRSVSWGVRRVLKDADYSDKMLQKIQWRLSTQELDAAIEFDKLSAWGDKEDGFFGEDLIFPDGYDQVIENLADGLEIYTGQPVKEITASNKSVKVVTEDTEYEGDFVIVTVPLGVLKKKNIVFDPPLPDSKIRAIDSLGMGNLNKVALKFNERMWPSDPHFIGYLSRIKGEFPVFVNWAHYTSEPYLLGIIGNQYARKLDQMNPKTLRQNVGLALSKAWKKSIQIEDYRYSAWAKDPYAGGSYSYLPVGVNGKMYDALAEPHARIQFAGEATNRGMSATVHGAYLSGLREAESIVSK